MSALGRYLLWQFSKSALAFYLVALTLSWLVNLLRLFELVTAKGQSFVTLTVQSFYSMPLFARDFLVVCMGAGLVRVLLRMQTSHELHAIHVNGKRAEIWKAAAIFALLGMVWVSAVTHFILPHTSTTMSQWRDQIAAQVVNANLPAGRFTSINDSVVVGIGSRTPDGALKDFFADDQSGDVHRTYFAKEASIAEVDKQFHIRLREGRVETLTEEGLFSSLEFETYELAVENLTGTASGRTSPNRLNSIELIAQVAQSKSAAKWFAQRMADGTRILFFIGMLTAIFMQPHARRGKNLVPYELLVLIVGALERSISSGLSSANPWGAFAGTLFFAFVLAAILAMRWQSEKLSPPPADLERAT